MFDRNNSGNNWTTFRGFNLQVSFDTILHRDSENGPWTALRRIARLGNYPSAYPKHSFRINDADTDGGYYAPIPLTPQHKLLGLTWTPLTTLEGVTVLIQASGEQFQNNPPLRIDPPRNLTHNPQKGATPQDVICRVDTSKGATLGDATHSEATPQGLDPCDNIHQGATQQEATPQGATPQGTAHQGTTHRVVTQQGAASKGATPQETSHQGAAQKGAASGRATFQGATHQRATQQGADSQETTPQGAAHQETTHRAVAQQGAASKRATPQETSHRGAAQQGATPERATPQGATHQGTTHRVVAQQGAASKGASPQEITHQEAAQQGADPQGTTSQGAAHQETTHRAVAQQGAASKGATPQETSHRGAAQQGATSERATPQGAAQQRATHQVAASKGATPQGITHQGAAQQGTDSQGATPQRSVQQRTTLRVPAHQGAIPKGATPRDNITEQGASLTAPQEAITELGLTPQWGSLLGWPALTNQPSDQARKRSTTTPQSTLGAKWPRLSLNTPDLDFIRNLPLDTPPPLIQEILTKEPPVIIIKSPGKKYPNYYLATLPEPRHVRRAKPDLFKHLTQGLKVPLFKIKISKPPLLGLYEYVVQANQDPHRFWTPCPSDRNLLILNAPHMTLYMRTLAYNHIHDL